MRASSEGFLPNTRSHAHVIGKMDRKGQMFVCTTCHKNQEEEEEKGRIQYEIRQIERKDGL